MDLSVNVDHVATLREARKENFPDPVYAAIEAELGGADGITVHLRGDQRHIKERDLEMIRGLIKTPLTLEMAATPKMQEIAIRIKPDDITLVPESPGEVTTQGGLDLLGVQHDLRSYISKLVNSGIKVGLFLDPNLDQVKELNRLGVQYIEINTDVYSRLKADKNRDEIIRIARFAKAVRRENIQVHAGHGLNYQNIRPLLHFMEITVYSIGFSIVSRAIFTGMKQATNEMVNIIKGAK
jgi:pyridoxine 5-phosphate synthase